MTKAELLSPAGNLEKLKMAVMYGADAVYLGGEEFSLRAYAGNFNLPDMEDGIRFAHLKGCKVYLALNSILHNRDVDAVEQYIRTIADTGIDAVILSDPAALILVRRLMPDMAIHLSTQANTTNWMSAQFWYEAGVKRIILARELSLAEISEIRRNTPQDLELEAFIHGSMCISYSGRCLLSSYLAGRDSNSGLCSHPCRWKYHLVEETRPGEYFPVLEDESGSFILNSKDLCMIRHISELAETGITGLKIEGRMKSSYYVATVTKAYREAIDSYYSSPDAWRFEEKWFDEVSKASHREYATGFYFGGTGPECQSYESSSYIRDYDFIGIVLDYDNGTGIATVEQRNKLITGDDVEVVPPKGPFFHQKISKMTDEGGALIESAPHPRMKIKLGIDRPVPEYSILRRPSA